MASLFDPISVALETVKTIEGVGSHKPDPIRFRIRQPVNPGALAKTAAFQRQHDLQKWSKYKPKKISLITKGKFSRHTSSSPGVVRLPLLSLSSRSSHVSVSRPSVTGVFKPVKRSAEAEEEKKKSEEEIKAEEPPDETIQRADDEESDEEEEEDEEAKTLAKFSVNQMRYWRGCQKYKVRINRKVLRNMDNFEMVLSMMKMSDMEFKALMAAMVGNDMIQRLDLTEVRLSDNQVVYLTDFFTEEHAVTDLLLGENALKGRILERFFDSLTVRDNLTYLDISGNDLRDKDIPMLANYIKSSNRLNYLYMRRNNFTESAGELFGKMMAENASLLDLDISQNRIRAAGAEKFLKGMMKNSSLERLDFSWNGLGQEGTKAVAIMLKKNSTLTSLNISGSRISGQYLELLYPALKKNSTLRFLMLSHNPLLMSDIASFLKELYKWSASGLKRVDFGSYQTLEESVIPLIDLLFWEKNIDIRYGSTLGHSDFKQKNDEVISRFRDDPLALVTKLRAEERMTLVKYFGQLDLEAVIESGQEEIGQDSFLYKMRNNKVTYKDLANRIKKAGNNPNDIIRNALEIAEITDSRAALVPRYSMTPDVLRRLYIKARSEGV